MNRSELASRVTAAPSLTRAEADDADKAVFLTTAEAFAGDDTVSIAGFGSFTTRSRAARTRRNPRTGELIRIATSAGPAFKATKTLSDAVHQ